MVDNSEVLVLVLRHLRLLPTPGMGWTIRGERRVADREATMVDMTVGKAVPEDQQLKKGVLTTWDALALSIAVIAPAMAASYNTSFAATGRVARRRCLS